MFRTVDRPTCRPGIARRAGLIGALLALALVTPALAQEMGPEPGSKRKDMRGIGDGPAHGVNIAKSCASPRKVGATTSCDITIGHADDFGDTLQIFDVVDVIDPLGDAVVITNLEIVMVSGNTTAVVGGSLPVLIGPPNSILSGLPGNPNPGVVVFREDTYVIQADDPDPLPDQAQVTIFDLCDDPGTVGCSTLPNVVQFQAATDLINPTISITKTPSQSTICLGPPATNVTYTYVVTNTGDTELGNVVVTDDQCGPVVYTSGDIDLDGILDDPEQFIDLNLNGVWDPGEPILMDNGNGVWDDAESWTYQCTAALSSTTTNTATVTSNVPGQPECTATAQDTATVTADGPSANPGDAAICPGQTAQICANPSGGAAPYTFSWTGPGGFAANTECILVGTLGTYCVTVTDANGCATTACAELTALTPPTCFITGPNQVCQGTTNAYFGPAGFASYAWTIAGNGSIVGPTNLQSVQVLAGAFPGSYTLTLTIIDVLGCTSTCTLNVDLDDCPVQEPEPGWNYLDNGFTLTGDQPVYWSALTGLPAAGGLAPFTALDPGFPPGRPAMDGSTDRVLRGYVVLWAVNEAGEEIRWNHMKGEGTIVNYRDGYAWEYSSVNFPYVGTAALNGQQTGTPGVLNLDGTEFAFGPDLLLIDFMAANTTAFSGPNQVNADPILTLHPLALDLRQEGDGPVTTKANFDIWNQNEVKFSETHRCITCWDSTRLALYDAPNSFVAGVLQTAAGKARVDGVASQVCDVDVDPTDGPLGANPNDVISTNVPLLGVISTLLRLDGGASGQAAKGTNLVELGTEASAIEYDAIGAPPPEGPGGARGDSSIKGSIVIFPHVELRWDNAGNLVQDTFLSLTNDYPADVRIQLYLIQGDPPVVPPAVPLAGPRPEGVDVLLEVIQRSVEDGASTDVLRRRIDDVLGGMEDE